MAEIDTRPLESVQEALTLFEPRNDHISFSPDRNEHEIDILTKELAGCKLQLVAKEKEKHQANLKLESLQKSMQELSHKYDMACLEAHSRIAQLEADKDVITSQQSEATEECKALRAELATARGELDAVKGSTAFVLREVELMETAMILERDSTKDALMRILQLNEAVLSSAVAAIRAEDERSVFFQEMTLEFLHSGKNADLVSRQLETIGSLERELTARTVEIDRLQSELKQVMDSHVDASSNGGDEEPRGDARFVGESSREDFQSVRSDHEKEIVSNGARADTDSVAGIIQETRAPQGGDDLVTEIVTVVSNSKEDGEFYTKEIVEAAARVVEDDDGYVLLVAKSAETDTLKDKLDAAHAEIGDLRFSLEEAVRRAELAEEGKAALERELREEIQKKRRRAPPPEDARGGAAAPPARLRPPAMPATVARRAARGDERARPMPGCLTLGKVLNMKYK